MKIVGLNFGHDAGVSLLVDGAFVGHWEKERHTGVKHAIGLTDHDIRCAFRSLKIGLDDIDRIATSTTQRVPIMLYGGMTVEIDIDQEARARLVDTSPNFYAEFKDTPRTGFHSMLAALPQAPQTELHINEYNFPVYMPGASFTSFTDIPYANKIPVVPAGAHALPLTISIEGRVFRGMHVAHHLCHAAYAYSQFATGNALILTYDGAASNTFGGGGLYFGKADGVTPIFPMGFHFGMLFDVLGNTLGLGPVGAAGKLMGLAGYGKPRFYDPRLVGNFADTKHVIHDSGPMISGRRMLEKWLVLVRATIPACDLRNSETPPQEVADLAASMQAMFTDSVLRLVKTAEAIADNAGFDHDAIVLSGGGALNCPTNSAIFERLGKRVFVPPAVNDEGLSVGAAYVCAQLCGETMPATKPSVADIAFKGPDYAPAQIKTTRGLVDGAVDGVVEHEDAARYLAEKIANGAVIGIFEGRAEIGPRALGHRSIIASPLLGGNWRKVNRIKNREMWRPFAPVVLPEDFDEHFEGCPTDSYYMLFNARVRHAKLPAITHRDGTARVQIVVPEIGFLHRLLVAFRDLTGFGVLLNTSFNDRGKPIVETPDDALAAFRALALDYLYLQGTLVERRGGAVTAPAAALVRG